MKRINNIDEKLEELENIIIQLQDIRDILEEYQDEEEREEKQELKEELEDLIINFDIDNNIFKWIKDTQENKPTYTVAAK